jgi:hypothetical protein
MSTSEENAAIASAKQQDEKQAEEAAHKTKTTSVAFGKGQTASAAASDGKEEGQEQFEHPWEQQLQQDGGADGADGQTPYRMQKVSSFCV